MTKKPWTLLALLAVVALVAAGNAAAKKPKPYQGVAGVTQGALASTPQSSKTQLPFTGADITIFLVGGAALVLVGYTLHRVGRNRS